MEAKGEQRFDRRILIFIIVLIGIFVVSVGTMIWQTNRAENQTAIAITERQDIGASITFDTTIAGVNIQERRYNPFHKKWVIENTSNDTIIIKMFSQGAGLFTFERYLEQVYSLPPHKIIAGLGSKKSSQSFMLCRGAIELGFAWIPPERDVIRKIT